MSQSDSRRRRVAAAVAVPSLMLAGALVAAGVAPDVASGATHSGRTTSHGALIRLEQATKYGAILADGDGKTLYLLTTSSSTSLGCTGSCTSIWPPVLTKGKPMAGKGVTKKMLGTVKRGSSRQVTYDGHPLYLYAGDASPGQVNGEGIESFGGTWYVLGASGSSVTAPVSSASSTASSPGW